MYNSLGTQNHILNSAKCINESLIFKITIAKIIYYILGVLG